MKMFLFSIQFFAHIVAALNYYYLYLFVERFHFAVCIRYSVYIPYISFLSLPELQSSHIYFVIELTAHIFNAIDLLYFTYRMTILLMNYSIRLIEFLAFMSIFPKIPYDANNNKKKFSRKKNEL